MKQVTLESLPKDVSSLLEAMREGRVVLTREGRPVAVLFGLEKYDDEDLGYVTDPGFWEMIRQRRAETKRVSLAEAMARLEADERAENSTRPSGAEKEK